MKLPGKLDFKRDFFFFFPVGICGGVVHLPLPLKGVHLHVLSCCCHGNLEILGYFLVIRRENSLVSRFIILF